jgi:hypothetical protein
MLRFLWPFVVSLPSFADLGISLQREQQTTPRAFHGGKRRRRCGPRSRKHK